MLQHLPMYHRIGAAAYKTELITTLALCKHLGNPQFHYKTIHIGGTNGKGSTSHFLASILQAAGYTVGLYTSPHLKDFRERIRFNGHLIPKSYVTRFISENQEIFEKLMPSFFEMTFALAIRYFSECKIDIGIFEVGMGGRLDSTNVISPELSVITNISYDHTFFLGNTLAEIASEKAGIIKKNIPVIIGETQQETAKIFIDKANDKQAILSFADKHFHVKKQITGSPSAENQVLLDIFTDNKLYLKNVECPLTGRYQQKNLCTVMEAVRVLNSKGFIIEKKHIRKGIRNVTRSTGLAGRWQILRKKPLTICDTGHNEEGIKEVLFQIRQTPHKKLHFVIGMVNDKDIGRILSLLPKTAVYYFCKANIPRGLDPEELAKTALEKGLKGEVFPTVRKAYQQALSQAGEDDLVFVGGSTFVVAEIL